MAHFAQLDENNTVLQVLVVDNALITDENGQEQEELGVKFFKNLLGQDTIWKQTSYNTHFNEHLFGGTPFRKNYAAIGFTYDAQRDAFIPPKPDALPEEEQYFYLDEDKCVWLDSRPPPPQPEPKFEDIDFGATRV